MDIVSGVGVIDKSVDVLDALRAGPCTLAELTVATQLPRATVHRLAAALETHGLVRRDSEGRFALGLALVGLGAAASAALPLVELALPALETLRRRTGESVQLFVRQGNRRLCLAALDATHELRTIVAVGSLLPLDRGSAGHVLNGAIGKHGWAESVGEREAGVASVSAPVYSSEGEIVAAVSVSGPIERMTRKPGTHHGAAVLAAAAAVTSELRKSKIGTGSR